MQTTHSTERAVVEAYEYCLHHGYKSSRAVVEVCKKLGYNSFSDYAYVYRVCNNYKRVEND